MPLPAHPADLAALDAGGIGRSTRGRGPRSLRTNAKVRAWALQLSLLGLLGGCLAWFALNTRDNLASRGIAVGFDFLGQTARFPISEHLLSYSPSDHYGWAYVVGLANTVTIAVPVIMLATLLGLGVGLARRSPHPLLGGLATLYVEIHRNTPLIVQLLFWYVLITTAFPPVRQALEPLPGLFLSVRGMQFPRLDFGGAEGWIWLAMPALVAAVVFGPRLLQNLTGRATSRWRIAALGTACIALALAVSGHAPTVDWPELHGFNFTGGAALTPEFTALLAGLVLYSAAFIGEIVRGGIDAVSRGQWEAGRAIGFTDGQTLRYVIFPQALRVIVPPLGSQYLNIIKNTTLALAVGYPDFASVAATAINQTGQAIEGILILLAVYLSISLGVSLLVNGVNHRIMLVPR